MKKQIGIVIISLLLLVISTSYAGINRYVDDCTNGITTYEPTGHTCTGGSDTVHDTIQHAADVVNEGDTVIVTDGTYTASSANIVSISRSGSSDYSITFKAENQWGAKLVGSNGSSDYPEFAFYISGSYINIENFEIYDIESTNSYVGSNKAFAIYGSNISIKGNKIHDIGRRDTASAYSQSGSYIRYTSSYVTFDSNIFYNIGRLNPYTTPSGSACVSPGYCYNHDHGLYVQSDHTTIINNIFYDDMKSGWAIQLDGSSSNPDGLNYVDIINNTFYSPNPGRDGHIVIYMDCNYINIQNNISHTPLNYFINDGNDYADDVSVKNNLVYGAGLISGSKCDDPDYTCSNNITGQDPKFVDLAKKDFHLLSNSPAIDTGLATYAPSYDFDGNSRPYGSNPDIGMDEYELGVVPHDYFLSASGGTENCDSIVTPCSMAWHNSHTPTPGDKYYLKAGDTFTFPIIPQGSGTSGNRITYGKYGAGARPIIDVASVALTGWAGGGTWQTAWSLSGSGNWGDGATRNYRNIIPAGQSSYNGSKVRVTLKHGTTAGDFVIVGTSIGEMTTADDYDSAPTRITWDTGNNGVTITGIGATKLSDEITYDFDKTKRHGVHIYTTSRYSALTFLSNATYGDTNAVDESQTQNMSGTLAGYVFGLVKLEVYSGIAHVFQLSQASSPTWVKFNGADGTHEEGTCPDDLNADKEWCHTTGSLYVYDTTDDPDSRSITRDRPYGIDLNGKDYIVIENLEVKNAGTAGIGTNGDADDIEIKQNNFTNVPIAIKVSGTTPSNVDIHDNVAHTLTTYFASVEAGTGHKIYNNTFDKCCYITGTGTTWTYENNIVKTASGYLIKVDDGVGALTIDYNNYSPLAGTPFHWKGTDYNFADWKSGDHCNCDSHSKNVDPLFTNETNKNYHLLQGSQCINTGTTISGRTNDYDGIAIQGLTDMGAFEMLFPPMSGNAIFSFGMEF